MFKNIIVKMYRGLRVGEVTGGWGKLRNEKLHYLYLHSLTNTIFIWRDSPLWARASSFTMFLDLAQRRATVGRTTLGE